MDDLVLAPRPDLSQETEIVFQMFEDIHEEDDIEIRPFLFSDVRHSEMNSFFRPTLTKRERLRRDLIPPEGAFFMHSFLDSTQHLASATPDIADSFRREPIPGDHLENVLGFPG